MFGQYLVVSLLIKVGRLRSGDGDVVHPFDPAHARVPRDDHAQREAVVGRQGFAVHLTGHINTGPDVHRTGLTSYARRTSPSLLIALSRGIDPPYDASCSHGATLDAKHAWSPAHDALSSGTPARRRTSRNGAPAQRTLAMVPSDHLMPSTLLPVFSAILARRFPAHCVRVV